VDEAPNMQTLNAHFRVGESSSGFGATVFNDVILLHPAGHL